jgi:RND family efflux transporter MFP subunit
MSNPILRHTARLALPMILAATMAACSDQAPAPVATGKAVQADVITVHTQKVPRVYITSGVITSDHRISVSSRLSGYIHEISVREGDHVHKGDVLFHIDPADARQALEQAQADLADAKTDLDRFKSLLASQAVSKQQFDKVRLRYQVAKSKVAQAKNQMSYAIVRAPVDGLVVEKNMNTGDLASPGTPIIVLENLSQLSVETHVSEQFIADIHEGDEATVRLSSMPSGLSAKVRQVVPAADRTSHQFLVKVTLPIRKEIRPGMFAEVAFHTGTRDALIIPPASIVHRSGLTGVYMVDSQGVLHYRLIRLGPESAAGVEVAAGISDGERIVAKVTPEIVSGERIAGGK